MVDEGFCPHCGVARKGWARFCGSCGREYDSPPAQPVARPIAASTPAPIAETAPVASKRRSSPIVWVIVGIAILVAGFLALSSGVILRSPGAPGIISTSTNLPPVGSIWFGQSFDTTTFEIRSRAFSTPAGQAIALVAQLPRSVASGTANIRISLDGTIIVNQALNSQGEGELFGMTYVPPVAGHYVVEITDIGGTVLANGSIDAR
jgi:hypothetical protein